MEPPLQQGHSWADPPEGIFDQIFSRLPSFADRACCTGVCRNWRNVATTEEHATPPLLPCLLRPSTLGQGTSCFHFFSKTTHRPAVPPSARFCGSAPGGWFVVAHEQWRDYALFKLSPLGQIALPDGLWGQEIPIPVDLRISLQPSALIVLAATASSAPTPDDGDYTVAAIAFGQHKPVVWKPGMERWIPLEPEQGMRAPALGSRSPILLEELEDVLYYRCDQHEGFYFLTSQEHLMVFDPEDDDGQISGDLDGYLFPDHRMTSPPESGQQVAGRYHVESDGRLLMVKRFISPGRGTVSFQVFTLQWEGNIPRGESSSTDLIGKLLFVGRGCSRAIQTGRSGPAFIYFLDDADGFRDAAPIAYTEKLYRCSDTGWFRYSPDQYIGKSWPEAPRRTARHGLGSTIDLWHVHSVA